MKKNLPALLFFLIGPFLYLTKAQTLKFTDSRHQPVEGIVVSIKTVGEENGSVLITDNRGTIKPNQPLPYIIQTLHFAFNSFRDTIYNTDSEKEFALVSNNINLNEVTVTGNYKPSDHSVYNTQVITKQQIEAQAANNVQDLFLHQLNVRVSNDQSTGSSIALQGIGGENIKVLIDGVPVIGRLANNINLSQLNLNNVERVEVINGPASVLYGTNALGGVINIITDASTNPPFKAGINTYYESNGQYNANGYINMHLRKSDVSINGGRNFFDGWSDNKNSRVDEWKPKEQMFGSLRIGQKVKNTKLVYQTGYFREKVTNRGGDIYGWPYQAIAYDTYFNSERLNNELSLSHLFDTKHDLKVTAAYSFYRYFRRTFRKDLVSLDEIVNGDPATHDTTDFGATMLRAVFTKDDPNSKINYQTGIDLNDEYTTGSRIVDNKKEAGDFAVFASLQYEPVKHLMISPAVRYSYNTEYKAPVVPSIQFMYEGKKSWVVRTSYGRGFRSPALKELYLEFVDLNHYILGNVNLVAETSDNIQLSADKSITKGKVAIKISPSLFYNSIKNRISLVSQADDKYVYHNFYKYITRGGQLITSLSVKSFEFSYGYSYTGIYNSEFEGAKFLNSFEMNTMLQYRVPKTKTVVALFWKYYGHQPQYLIDQDENIFVFNGEDYSMADASITQRFFHDRIMLGVGAKNILDITTIKNAENGGAHQSADNVVYTGMGRSYFVRFQYQFTK